MKNKSIILKLHEQFKDPNFFNNYLKELKNKVDVNDTKYHSILTKVELKPFAYDESNLLVNIPYSIKDNISTKGIRTTGGSKLLSEYVPLFDSFVYSLLKKDEAMLVSKDTLDEFGLGGTGTWCGLTKIINPYDKNRITAGSSSGSNVNVTTDLVAFSIGTDTGDSIRHPASFLNNVGYKPSYGLVSRYGVFPFSPSLDTVGIIAKYITDVSIVLTSITKLHDQRDFTNIKIQDHHFYQNLKAKPLNEIKFVYIKNAEKYMYEDAKVAWIKYLSWLKTKVQIKEVEFNEDLLDALLPTYYAISFAEATTSLANLTGMTFGHKIIGKDYYDTVIKTRTSYLGEQVKKRFTLGSYVLTKDHYEEIFVKAKKIRRKIVNEVNNLLKDVDGIIIPGTSSFALTYEELEKTGMTKCDDLLLFANFSGNPSLTIPAIMQNPKFLGINILGKWLHDQDLLNVGLSIENLNEEYEQGE